MSYEFKQVTTDTACIKECAELLRLVFPRAPKFTDTFLQWEYAANPAGKIVGFNAYHEGKLAAHYVIQPVVAKVNGKEMKGLLSLNTATHPSHQGKKLFTQLAEKSYDLAASMGYKFVVGVANANSTHGFVKKLGFSLVGQLDARVGYGDIDHSNIQEYCFERIWSKELLQWRIDDPAARYKIAGHKILAHTGTPGVKAILGEFGKELQQVKDPAKQVSGIFSLWIGMDHSINWKKTKYVSIPMKFRPSPLNLIFNNLDRKETISRECVKFQAIDFDAY